jgi:hypothetical protein
LGEEVANAAVRADLVLLSARGMHGLPEDVRRRFREWLERYAGEPPASGFEDEEAEQDADARGGAIKGKAMPILGKSCAADSSMLPTAQDKPNIVETTFDLCIH